MLPWMSTTGDSRTSTTPLHYVISNQWHARMDGTSRFEAICGARVLPLWGAYDEAVATRLRCPECVEYERRLAGEQQDSKTSPSGRPRTGRARD